MTKYESSVKHIVSPVGNVYGKLSDLTNLEAIKKNAENPELRDRILQQAADKVKPEQLDQLVERLKQMEFTADTVSLDAGPIGRLTLRIIEREEPKLVKFALEGAPMQANLWLQMLPEGDGHCAMKATLGADLNFFLKQMLNSKLKDGVDRLADMLAMIPY